MNGQYRPRCSTGCIAEHLSPDEPCAFQPIAVPVIDTDPRHDPVVLVGGFRDRGGRSWIELDIDGHGARVDTDRLTVALAAVRGLVDGR